MDLRIADGPGDGAPNGRVECTDDAGPALLYVSFPPQPAAPDPAYAGTVGVTLYGTSGAEGSSWTAHADATLKR